MRAITRKYIMHTFTKLHDTVDTVREHIGRDEIGRIDQSSKAVDYIT